MVAAGVGPETALAGETRLAIDRYPVAKRCAIADKFSVGRLDVPLDVHPFSVDQLAHGSILTSILIGVC